ncbi:hypothetical protein RHMOL_Rhmol04G0052600 [Rhododendron molle]|uniref:Uncharacterized protein n=1 Tax=Rhododendron molle TaxID=49168 RepID=A0ACC0NYI9_RHOML|nr:hypothetical protein RHMOL_Rhmol04G0052600 [Rhododendron molle]
MSRSNAEPVKITFINTEYVETDATSFKSVVQKLTGKDSTVAAEPKSGRARSKVGTGGTGGVVGSGLSRGMSFKDFDRLLTELPHLDELYRLC